MDQTRQYADGNIFYWNKKLTTFPGVFIISAIFYNIVNLLTRVQFVHFLRTFNSFNGTFIGAISCASGQFNTHVNKMIFQLLVVFLPINYFFNFLFYTDTFSNSIVYSKTTNFIVIIN